MWVPRWIKSCLGLRPERRHLHPPALPLSTRALSVTSIMSSPLSATAAAYAQGPSRGAPQPGGDGTIHRVQPSFPPDQPPVEKNVALGASCATYPPAYYDHRNHQGAVAAQPPTIGAFHDPYVAPASQQLLVAPAAVLRHPNVYGPSLYPTGDQQAPRAAQPISCPSVSDVRCSKRPRPAAEHEPQAPQAQGQELEFLHAQLAASRQEISGLLQAASERDASAHQALASARAELRSVSDELLHTKREVRVTRTS